MKPGPLALAHPELLATPWARACYDDGATLALHTNLEPAHVAWDADEVLWDWVIDLPEAARSLHATLPHRSLQHAQWIRFRPGMLSLLMGFTDAAHTRGADPRLRVWTNGWGTRLVQIAQQVPVFARLLGIDPDAPPPVLPTVFSRADFERASARLGAPDDAARGIAVRQHLRDAGDSTFKSLHLPAPDEFPDLRRVRFLVDDNARNAERFARSADGAVHVERARLRGPLPRIPHVTVGAPQTTLERLGETTATRTIARALRQLASAPRGTVLRAPLQTPGRTHDALLLRIEFAHEHVRDEWLLPARRLQRAAALPRRARRRVAG